MLVPTFVLALLLFWAGERVAERQKTLASGIWIACAAAVAAVPGVAMVLYYLHGFDDSLWFYRFRSFPCSELAAAGMGLLAGAFCGFFPKFRYAARALAIPSLCLGIAIPYLKPFISPLSESQFQSRWSEGVCQQSTGSSCGPASAATILKSLGFEVTEKQLARECYTYEGGTENWYLARALRRRGCEVRYRIETGLPPDCRRIFICQPSLGWEAAISSR